MSKLGGKEGEGRGVKGIGRGKKGPWGKGKETTGEKSFP